MPTPSKLKKTPATKQEILQEVFAKFFNDNQLGYSTDRDDVMRFMFTDMLEKSYLTGSLSLKAKGFEVLFKEAFGEEINLISPKKEKDEIEKTLETELPPALKLHGVIK